MRLASTTRVEGAGGFRLRFLDVFDLIEVEHALADFRPDLILCSDVLYDGKMARAVAQVLLAACRVRDERPPEHDAVEARGRQRAHVREGPPEVAGRDADLTLYF